jgi:hypothetical protein
LISHYRNTTRNDQGFKFHPELEKEGSLHKKISAGEQGVLPALFQTASLAAIHDGFSPSWNMNHGCDLAVHREKDSGTQRG